MKNYSIAIFGSSMRENFDKYSDKDILIVADTYKETKKLNSDYENQGFSVSTYTYSKLKYMSENGSLFIDHLVKESKILVDKRNNLKVILSNHKSKKPDLKQFQDNKVYFEILKFLPNTIKGFGWFCDCLYVGIRNYLILKSAQNGNYNFSYLTLLEELKEDEIITQDEIKILRELRVVKKNYREKIAEELPSKEYIQNVINVVSKLGLLEDTKTVNEIDFQNFVINSMKSEKYSNYQKLRLIEMYYFLNGVENKEVERIISNPQFYTSSFKRGAFITNIIKKIAETKNVLEQNYSKLEI